MKKGILVLALVVLASVGALATKTSVNHGIGDAVAPVVVDKSTVTGAPVGQILYDITAGGFFALSPQGLWSALSSSGPRSEVWLSDNTGFGSTSNKIAIYGTTGKNVGTAITYASNSVDGTNFTINEDGIYAISMTHSNVASAEFFGASINLSLPVTTAMSAINAADRIMVSTVSAANGPSAVSTTLFLSAGDVIRPHTDGLTLGTNASYSQFRITKVSN